LLKQFEKKTFTLQKKIMKKIVFSFVLSIVLFSCKKDYVCECTASPSNTTVKATIKGVSKKTAKDICVGTSYVMEDYSTNPPSKITVTETCSLK
jgi:hypothetical protein